jgi:SAM-dependent methyltransferase
MKEASEVFGLEYAGAYDALYRDKNYAEECELIDSLIKRYGTSGRQILDLGCGTGSHCVRLAQMGYSVVGVDRSEAMLARARAGIAQLNGHPDADLHLGDIRSIALGRQFDCALLMFSVLGYQLEDCDVQATLETVHRHLRPGGLALFDVWYGPSVLSQRPSERLKRVSLEDTEIVRAASGTLDPTRHVCSVEYRTSTHRGAEVIAECFERHEVRYFFRSELQTLCERSGLELFRLCAFPDVDRDPSEDSWNVLALARCRPDQA